jgi:hypothetical protein
MAKPLKPEPKFFLRDELYAKGLSHYSQAWFAGVGDDQVAGEKSTDYLESAPAAERIARDLPRVKLVFILREPVGRAYSNYLWTKMNGLETESFAAAIRLEEQRERELPEASALHGAVFIFLARSVRGSARAVLREVSPRTAAGRPVRRHQGAPGGAR